jgi:hypothetical protein
MQRTPSCRLGRPQVGSLIIPDVKDPSAHRAQLALNDPVKLLLPFAGGEVTGHIDFGHRKPWSRRISVVIRPGRYISLMKTTRLPRDAAVRAQRRIRGVGPEEVTLDRYLLIASPSDGLLGPSHDFADNRIDVV